MKKFIVAIDWKAVKSGYTFLELEAKTEAQAMIEAPAVACRYGATIQYASDDKRTFQGIGDYDGMKDVWCLRIFTQTKEEAKRMEATFTPHIFYPSSYKWDISECDGEIWDNVEVIKSNF